MKRHTFISCGDNDNNEIWEAITMAVKELGGAFIHVTWLEEWTSP
ncbi:hypothetical protein [Paenibacillus harenae]|nr:hypothetical protein [Paenibacillus harenae]MDQ0063107.1 hypothetical protein [Paenibacillus harenae]